MMIHTVAIAQTTVLADWDTAPDGTVSVGDDFDPTLDNTLTCSGCWYSRLPDTTYSHSDSIGVVTGTGALKANIVGKGNGGEYSVPINGVDFNLDTHFDYPLVVSFSNSDNPAVGGPDPRYTAINGAVNGNQGLFTVDFDVTYDIAQMRSIAWQAPEETVDPEGNGQFPQRYFWVGMQGNGGTFFPIFDQAQISPFDAQFDEDPFPTFHVQVPLPSFDFPADANPAAYSFGIVYNSVFGTLPAGSNTTGADVYFDNFELRAFDPREVCDLNSDEDCTLSDFELFMGQNLVANPTLGDFDNDGDNDFFDFQEFESNYDLWIEIQGGSGSLQSQLAGVPEPASWLLVGFAVIGFVVAIARKRAHFVVAIVAAVAIAASNQAAEAQLVESFETIGNWTAFAGAAANANPSVELSTIGATNGSMSMLVTQAQDTIGDADFSWNAATTPNWVAGDMAFDVLSNAVNIGAEHFNLLADVTFDPANTFDTGVNTMAVTLGLNFVGQDIGAYAGEAEQFTTTATIPLSNFNLPDVEDEGAGSYSAQIGFTADALQFPFGAYIDNIRLEQISEPDLLTLEIDRADGTATLMNLTANPIAWDYMEIKSVAGSLDADGWDSLDDQDADGAGTWIEAGGSSATALVEASLLGTHTLMPAETLSLGALFSGGVEDVDLEIRRAAGPSFRTYDQIVTYVGESGGVLGDYNDDGIVNAADYVVFRNTLAGGGSLMNEGATPGVVDQEDYNFWVSRFGETSGSGSASATSVPEPSAVCLLICTLVGLFPRRR
jgi:hypothetical protein